MLWFSKIESSVVKQILSELFMSNFLPRINAHKIWGFSLLYQGNADDCLRSLCDYEALADSTTGMLLSGDQSSTQKSKQEKSLLLKRALEVRIYGNFPLILSSVKSRWLNMKMFPFLKDSFTLNIRMIH